MSPSPTGLVVAVLATWRVTHLLNAEDGPADLFVHLRRLVGDGFLGSLLDCFYCLSLWIALPFALLAGSTWPERGMLWLALSGGACLLERWKPGPPTAALYLEDKVEDKDGTDVLLRSQASVDLPTPGHDGGAPAGGPGTDARDGRDVGSAAAPDSSPSDDPLEGRGV